MRNIDIKAEARKQMDFLQAAINLADYNISLEQRVNSLEQQVKELASKTVKPAVVNKFKVGDNVIISGTKETSDNRYIDSFSGRIGKLLEIRSGFDNRPYLWIRLSPEPYPHDGGFYLNDVTKLKFQINDIVTPLEHDSKFYGAFGKVVNISMMFEFPVYEIYFEHNGIKEKFDDSQIRLFK